MDPCPAPDALSDLELLGLAAGLQLDASGRLAGVCGVRLAIAREGQLVFAGAGVPDALVPALVRVAGAAPRASSPDADPPALAACRRLLEAVCGPLAVGAGPYYLIGPDVRAETGATVVLSDTPAGEGLRRRNPGGWEPDEWDDLLDGTLGPWAMATVDGRVVSICHTPLPMTGRAAECGVWTDPDHRGWGYAPAVTAAWADLLRPTGRALFYSTDAGNRASQRVAARLRLRPLGWTWTLSRADAGPGSARHPLSPPRAAR